jgi:hypothetical protein
MKKFRIVPLSTEYAEKIRRNRKDDFGLDVIEQVAKGRGPCRVSLKPFKPGVDKRLLIKHNPFLIDNAYSQPGPIFINADEIESYKDIHRFPEEIKADREHFKLTLVGYSSSQMMVFSQLVGDDDVDDLIINVFEKYPAISYLHARSAEACCYICTIERA